MDGSTEEREEAQGRKEEGVNGEGMELREGGRVGDHGQMSKRNDCEDAFLSRCGWKFQRYDGGKKSGAGWRGRRMKGKKGRGKKARPICSSFWM